MYYNTTGIDIAGTIRQRPQIVGYARFDGCGGFNPNRPSQMIDRVFECAEPCVWQGQNKLLFKRLLNAPEKPDGFLVVVRAQLVGKLTVGRTDWRSAGTWLISFSECGDQQEAMLLMAEHSRLQTELGRFVLESEAARPWVARLVLVSAQQE
ncbi:MAG: hypothetical protein ABSG11_23760 [Candidatus Korobacteraceae bacterium]